MGTTYEKRGIHLFSELTNEQNGYNKNITNLEINGILYYIDVKAKKHSFLIVEPYYYTNNNYLNQIW